MAITTGTTWDLVLSAPTQARASCGAGGMSPRALYQELLYDRVQVLDLRTVAERATGVLHPDLRVDVVDPAELVAHLVNTPAVLPVVLLSQDGGAATNAARQLRDLGLARVNYAVGGYVAWARAGLPVLASPA